jgi:hypothetical protein
MDSRLEMDVKGEREGERESWRERGRARKRERQRVYEDKEGRGGHQREGLGATGSFRGTKS